MNYGGWFENKGFNTFYLNSSKYAKKQELLDAFYSEWYNLTRVGLHVSKLEFVKKTMNAANKKAMKVRLQGRGFTPAVIDGLFRSVSQWIKANS